MEDPSREYGTIGCYGESRCKVRQAPMTAVEDEALFCPAMAFLCKAQSMREA